MYPAHPQRPHLLLLVPLGPGHLPRLGRERGHEVQVAGLPRVCLAGHLCVHLQGNQIFWQSMNQIAVLKDDVVVVVFPFFLFFLGSMLIGSFLSSIWILFC